MQDVANHAVAGRKKRRGEGGRRNRHSLLYIYARARGGRGQGRTRTAPRHARKANTLPKSRAYAPGLESICAQAREHMLSGPRGYAPKFTRPPNECGRYGRFNIATSPFFVSQMQKATTSPRFPLFFLHQNEDYFYLCEVSILPRRSENHIQRESNFGITSLH